MHRYIAYDIEIYLKISKFIAIAESRIQLLYNFNRVPDELDGLIEYSKNVKAKKCILSVFMKIILVHCKGLN